MFVLFWLVLFHLNFHTYSLLYCYDVSLDNHNMENSDARNFIVLERGHPVFI